MQTDTQKQETLAALDSMRLLADSPTLLYVLNFAARMEAKLAKNRHKGDREGWINDNPDALWFRLEEEANELQEALRQVRHKVNVVAHERDKIINEAADIGNFAMMIADIYGLSANAPHEPRGTETVNNQKPQRSTDSAQPRWLDAVVRCGRES